MTPQSEPTTSLEGLPLWVELAPEQGAQIAGGWWGYHAPSTAIATPHAVSSTQMPRTRGYDYGYYGLPTEP